jgi:hypothetical protein
VKKFLPGQIDCAIGRRNTSGLTGYLPAQPDFSFPVVGAGVNHDITQRIDAIDWKARGEEIHEAIRQASVEMMIRNRARDKAARDLAIEVKRATDAYRHAHKLEGFSPEMFSMCRFADVYDYAWIICNQTGERVCEWRWNELLYDGAKAIMSFNFSAFDGLTTKDLK